MTGMGVDHECPEHLLQFHVPGLGSISFYVVVFTAIAIAIAHPPDHVVVVIGPFRFLVVIRLELLIAGPDDCQGLGLVICSDLRWGCGEQASCGEEGPARSPRIGIHPVIK